MWSPVGSQQSLPNILANNQWVQEDGLVPRLRSVKGKSPEIPWLWDPSEMLEDKPRIKWEWLDRNQLLRGYVHENSPQWIKFVEFCKARGYGHPENVREGAIHIPRWDKCPCAWHKTD